MLDGVPPQRAGHRGDSSRPHLAAFAALGGDPELLRPLVEVRTEYLGGRRSRRCAETYGTLERYVADGLGVDAATRHALRRAFVEPG